jgi:hypothetical protein
MKSWEFRQMMRLIQNTGAITISLMGRIVDYGMFNSRIGNMRCKLSLYDDE